MLQPHMRMLARALPPLLSLLVVLALLPAARLTAEGSATLYPADARAPYRANLEWRTATYGSTDSPRFNLLRRTLLKLYVATGEYILLGSSAVGVGGTLDNGDIRVFVPGQVSGPIGREVIPALAGTTSPSQSGAFANGFSCVAQRAAARDARGRIASRAAELAGPNTSNNLRPDGYTPCIYRAPAAGIYDVVFTGPSGNSSNAESQLSGLLAPAAADFGSLQQASVTAWDVTVRADLSRAIDERGRLFLYYMAGNTGGGGRTVGGGGYIVTPYGFIYRVSYGGDPYGFIVYANQFGFQDSDGSPLYHDVMADPSATTQEQNELRELQGGVQLLPPEYPIFFDEPHSSALDALGISRTPQAPSIAGLRFTGASGGIITTVGAGGSFAFTTNQPGVYSIVISQDGVDFVPTQPRNRLLRNIAAAAGTVTVSWDGLANDDTPFAVGSYQARLRVQGGEIHFPFLDVENNRPGGPIIQLINPPDGTGDGLADCPPWDGGCFGAFYDDTGYRTAERTLVGTAVGGPLCPAGVGGPPRLLASDQLNGYDTRTDQRSFGFPYDANPAGICQSDGGFGDKKGMDLWTFYPSNLLQAPIVIIAPPLVITLLEFRAEVEDGEVVVRWTTGAELNTAGFRLLRSTSGTRAAAVTVTDALILARGSSAVGASYRWGDAGVNQGDRTTYWLQEVEHDGAVNEYGPAKLDPGAGTADAFNVWLPALRGSE